MPIAKVVLNDDKKELEQIIETSLLRQNNQKQPQAQSKPKNANEEDVLLSVNYWYLQISTHIL